MSCASRHIIFFTMLCAASALHAQGSREFWGSFLNIRGSVTPDLVITSDSSSVISITAAGVTRTKTITAGQPLYYQLPASIIPSADEEVLNTAVHVVVTAGSAIQVVLANIYSDDGEATRLLPVEELGTKYLVLAYPSASASNSECCIVATQDSTVVTYIPHSKTLALVDSNAIMNVQLNAGEVYMVQSDNTDLTDPSTDITGTKIFSNKPIAVFGGNNWSAIPDNISSINPLYEQIPPVATFGTKFFAMPFMHRHKGDLFRLTATQDSTDVYIGGWPPVRLDQSETFSITLLDPTAIVATRPIGIAQFSHSYAYDNLKDLFGDPYMLLVPPVSNANDTVSFLALKSQDSNYVNIVQLSNLYPIFFDGVDITTFDSLVNMSDGIVCHWVRVAQGQHRLTSGSPFLATVYGESFADGYGYTINAATFSPSDTTKPQVSVAGKCDTGFIVTCFDTLPPASGISLVQVLKSFNCTAAVLPFQICDRSARVVVRATIPGQPVSFALNVTDCSGNTTTFSDSCSGATDSIAPSFSISGDCINGLQIDVADTGAYPSGIATINVVQATNMNVVVPNISGCPAAVAVQATVINLKKTATLVLDISDCAGNISRCRQTCGVFVDTTPPIYLIDQECTNNATMYVNDSDATNDGILRVDILDSLNSKITITPFVICSKYISVTCPPIDPKLPASFLIRLMDCDSNIVLVHDTCPPSVPDTIFLSVDYAHGLPGTTVDLPIYIAPNPRPFTFTDAAFALAYDPSIAQFQEFIDSNSFAEHRVLRTISDSAGIGFIGATLTGMTPVTTAGKLITARFYLMAGTPGRSDVFLVDSRSRFDNNGVDQRFGQSINIGAITLDTLCGWDGLSYADSSISMQVSPNPANTALCIGITGAQNSDVQLSITSVLGNCVFNTKLLPNHAILRSFTTPCTTLPAGVYFVTAISRGQRLTKEIVIAR